MHARMDSKEPSLLNPQAYGAHKSSIWTYDAATVIGFLRQHGLDKIFNEYRSQPCNTCRSYFPTELQVAADAGMLGSMMQIVGDYSKDGY